MQSIWLGRTPSCGACYNSTMLRGGMFVIPWVMIQFKGWLVFSEGRSCCLLHRYVLCCYSCLLLVLKYTICCLTWTTTMLRPSFHIQWKINNRKKFFLACIFRYQHSTILWNKSSKLWTVVIFVYLVKIFYKLTLI